MFRYLWVFLIAMVPLIELRGAIPIAQVWGIPLTIAYPIAILGNLLPVPFIYFFAKRVLRWGQDKPYIGPFFRFCLTKGERAGHKLQQKAGKQGIFIALLLFVGIPLPGTGAWTGTLGASLLDLDAKTSILACLCGVLLAGVLMSLLGSGLLHLLGVG